MKNIKSNIEDGNISKSFKVIDKRGQNKQANLYPTPSNNGKFSSYRRRLHVIGDTPKVVSGYDRIDQIYFARGLFASMPDLGGALISKASWCVNSGFAPVYNGADKAWGEKAEKWLTEKFYPVCNVLGSNYDFRTTLHLSCLGIDIDGSSGMILTSTAKGFPQVQLIPSHRIGNRGNEKVVAEGKFAGYEIIDGVIINDSGRPIGYRILGDRKEDDIDISTQNMQLLFEPEWSDQLNGISRVARSITDWMDSQDVDEFTKRSVKIAASIGLLHTTEDGVPDTGANTFGIEEDATTDSDSGNDLQMEYINGGEIYYLKGNAGEDIKVLQDTRPSPNTEAFMGRVQRRALYACGWPVELLDPSKLNGGAVRLIQDLARKSISARQLTLERRARLIVNYAITKAMQGGMLDQNNNEWYTWNFTKGSQIQVDLGNEEAAQREAYKLGTTTLSDIASKHGVDWMELREQQMRETIDLLERAKTISVKFNINLDAALALLSQRTPNNGPITNGQSIDNTLDNTPINVEE